MHFVYCWEMGADLGHIIQLATIGEALKAKGHQVSAVIKDTTHAIRYLHPLSISWLQAPLSMGSRAKNIPLNHADILLGQGYDNSTSLAGLVHAWRSLLQLLRPDCVICEAAPTAALVARTLGLRTLCLDNGFFSPPLSEPLPALRDWIPVSHRQLLERESLVLKHVNRVMATLALDPLAHFTSLFDNDTYWLTWPEINHFGIHSSERHLGPILPTVRGVTLAWPEGRGKRIFAYLKPNCSGSLPAIEWCLAKGYRLIAYLPGWPQEIIQKLQKTRKIIVSAEPIELAPILAECDFTLCHGGAGTVTHSLMAGKPLLLIPAHLEQFRTARMAVERHMALMPLKPAQSETFGFDITLFERCSKHAALFARKQPSSQKVMNRLIEILQSAGNQSRIGVAI